MEIELKSCPFCGGKAQFWDGGMEGAFEDWGVECTDCGIAFIAHGEGDGCITTKEEAAAEWNRRAQDD